MAIILAIVVFVVGVGYANEIPNRPIDTRSEEDRNRCDTN